MNQSEKALGYLRRNGWIQNGLYARKEVNAPACILGALRMYPGVEGNNKFAYLTILDVIEEQYPDRLTEACHSIPTFNDHPDTTFADVERVLEKAAIRRERSVRAVPCRCHRVRDHRRRPLLPRRQRPQPDVLRANGVANAGAEEVTRAALRPCRYRRFNDKKGTP